MGIVFALRGDSFDARYSTSGKVAAKGPATASWPVIEAGAAAGVIGDSVIDADRAATAVHSFFYPGNKNIPSGRAISILMRCAFGVNNANLGLWGFQGAHSNIFAALGLDYRSTGSLRVAMVDENNNTGINGVTFAWTPSTGVYYDILLTFTGDTTASGCVVYVDGVSLGSTTSTRTWPDPRTREAVAYLILGAHNVLSTATTTRIRINEFIIWDSVINPASVGLVGGTGALDGASRTAFVDVAAFDGQSNSEPGIANVRSGTAYAVAGTAYTGTAAIPSAANVRSGTATDNTTGTLDLPLEADVKLGVEYDGATKTGTYDPPAPAVDYPAETDVRSGVEYDDGDLVGTLDLPLEANVRAGITFDGATKTGTLDVGQSQVLVQVNDNESVAIEVQDNENVTVTVEG